MEKRFNRDVHNWPTACLASASLFSLFRSNVESWRESTNRKRTWTIRRWR